MLFLALKQLRIAACNRDLPAHRRAGGRTNTRMRIGYTAVTWSICMHLVRTYTFTHRYTLTRWCICIYDTRTQNGRYNDTGWCEYRETAWCSLYFNLARPLLDTNIIQLGIVSRRPSKKREKDLDLHWRDLYPWNLSLCFRCFQEPNSLH